MTRDPIELAELEAAWTLLLEWAASALLENERRFLLSIKQGEPVWALLSFAVLGQWPAIEWKLHNIRQMNSPSHNQAVDRLRAVLGT